MEQKERSHQNARDDSALVFLFPFHFCSIGKYVLAMAASIPASREVLQAGELLSAAVYPEMSGHSWESWNHGAGTGQQGVALAFLWTLAGTFLVLTASPSLGCRINLQCAERKWQLYPERCGAGQAESRAKMWHCSSRTSHPVQHPGQGFRSGLGGSVFKDQTSLIL